MIASGNLSFRKKNFGWLHAWELNPEGLLALAKSICHLRGFIIAEG
jgi:hypothetical protein